MKNVLFIVYYFPPMGGSGVQRPLKFAKYLRGFGWNPIILCPEPGTYQFFDESLNEELRNLNLEVHRVEAKTPFHVLGKKGRSTGLITGLLAKALRKVSRTVYFPDNKKGWIEPAVNKAKEIISEKNIEIVFSTAPPFSNHLIGKQISEEADIPLVVDYRDLFTGNHFENNLSAKAFRRKKELEKSWLSKAAGATVLDEHARGIVKEIGSEHSPKIKVISHGFDLEDYIRASDSTLNYQKGKLNWLYSGLFYESNQPDNFLHAMKELINEKPEMKNSVALHFQGGLDNRIKNLTKKLGLHSLTFDYGYIPHEVAVANLMSADVLWMISNFDENLKQIKSGKLFEYIGSKKTILGLVHDGEAQNHLRRYRAGFWAKPTNIEDIKATIFEIFEKWKEGELPSTNEEFVKEFDRKKITGELASFFDELVAMKSEDIL